MYQKFFHKRFNGEDNFATRILYKNNIITIINIVYMNKGELYKGCKYVKQPKSPQGENRYIPLLHLKNDKSRLRE